MQTMGATALEELGCVLTLTLAETRVMRQILHEAVTNDLDLLEDLAYAQRLAGADSDAAIARVSLAVRLDVAMQT